MNVKRSMNNINKEIVVFGASGHAKVVIDAIEKQNIYKIIGIIDKNLAKNSIFQKYPVLGSDNVIEQLHQKNKNLYGIIAIGDNALREKIYHNIISCCPNFKFATIIHPSAVLASHVRVGMGTVILALSGIGVDSVIGEHTIINTAAIVEHDCIIENFCSIAPRSVLAGNVTIKAHAFIGTGAAIIPGKEVGSRTIIGAAAVVTQSIPSDVVAVGVPAGVIKKVSGESK